MKKARQVLINDSSEEDYDNPMYYNATYMGQCLPTIEKFFQSIESGDEPEIVQSLAFLSSEFSMVEEQILATQPLDKVLNLLLRCLNSGNSEVLLQSMTCITLILDTLPELSEIVVHYGGIQLICEKMNNFGFIDLSEQAVRALEKISFEFPMDTLEARAIESVVAIIDYFDLEVQKKILNIMCNSIRALESIEIVERQILPQIPAILTLVKHKGTSDLRIEKVLEFLTIFIENLIMILPQKGDNFKNYSKALVDYGMIRILLDIFPSHLSLVLRLLYNLCDHSALVVKNFLTIGGFDIIKEALLGSEFLNNEMFTGILDLMDSLIPKIPATEPWNKEKLDFYNLHPEHMQSFSELILPRTISIYENFLSKDDKMIMISILEKILKAANMDLISNYLTCQSFSTFISELMISKDLSTVRAALRISLTLYEKIPQKISLNFAREGVIARIAALKDPDRLKEFKKVPGKKSSGNFDELILRAGEMRNPYQIESMLSNIKCKLPKPANLEDYKKDLIIYSKKILDKHKSYENKKAPRIGKEIKMIAQKLSNCFGESAQDILLKITALLNSSERLSYYEISNSSLAESLWKWLSENSPEKLLIRLQEFLKIFTKDSIHGENFLALLIKYLIGTANFIHHFRIILHDSKALHSKRNHKVKIILEYNGHHFDENLLQNPDFLIRHNLFLAHSKLQICTHYLFSFQNIKELLLRVSSDSDLYQLAQQKMINESTFQMFAGRPCPNNLQIKIINGCKELSRGATVLNLVTKKSQMQLKFRITKRDSPDLPIKFLKSPREIIENIVQESIHVGLEAKDKSYCYFRLVKLLYQISEYLPHLSYLVGTPNLHPLPLPIFSSSKLSALLSRQLQDAVAIHGNAPAQWVKHMPLRCKFLFYLQSRSEFMENFGFDRVYKTDKKHRCTVRRECLLEDAMKILEDVNVSLENMLEIEYEGEVGTGLGPTVEFFSLVSQEVKKLHIWRNMCEHSGLFPAPLSECGSRWEYYFEFVGKLIGKALLDGRHIDFQLSPVLWKLVFSQAVSLADMGYIDKQIGKALFEILARPAGIEKSELMFAMPGYYDIELKPNGKNILVCTENAEEYVTLAASLSICQVQQAKALRKGLNSMLCIDVLSIFYYNEIEDLLCGENLSSWDLENLKNHIVPAHGYNANSKTFCNLLMILSNFQPEQRTHFLEFVTGFPRLPLGGFSKLTPKLSVVKKDVECDPDTCLPSVMTCQNYLKIPDYSSLEVLRQNLEYAIQEGRHAFHLS